MVGLTNGQQLQEKQKKDRQGLHGCQNKTRLVKQHTLKPKSKHVFSQGSSTFTSEFIE